MVCVDRREACRARSVERSAAVLALRRHRSVQAPAVVASRHRGAAGGDVGSRPGSRPSPGGHTGRRRWRGGPCAVDGVGPGLGFGSPEEQRSLEEVEFQPRATLRPGRGPREAASPERDAADAGGELGRPTARRGGSDRGRSLVDDRTVRERQRPRSDPRSTGPPDGARPKDRLTLNQLDQRSSPSVGLPSPRASGATANKGDAGEAPRAERTVESQKNRSPTARAWRSSPSR
jgi:hypothetical protein